MQERSARPSAEWAFAASDLRALRAVRGEVIALLRRYGEPSSDFDSCAVVISELMSNAAVHGPGGQIRVTLDWTSSTPLVAVTDGGRGFVPTFGLPPPNREGGRGLFLVRSLADTPQVTVGDAGCTVTVRLPVTRFRSNSAP